MGTVVTNDGDSEMEIRRRIGIAKSKFVGLGKLFYWPIPWDLKIKLLKESVFAVFLYCAETWTLKESDKKKIDAFEMWCYRKMLRINQAEDRVTNVDVLKRARKSKELVDTIIERKKKFNLKIGESDSLEKLIAVGEIEPKNRRGRRRRRWEDDVHELSPGLKMMLSWMSWMVFLRRV